MLSFYVYFWVIISVTCGLIIHDDDDDDDDAECRLFYLYRTCI